MLRPCHDWPPLLIGGEKKVVRSSAKTTVTNKYKSKLQIKIQLQVIMQKNTTTNTHTNTNTKGHLLKEGHPEEKVTKLQTFTYGGGVHPIP